MGNVEYPAVSQFNLSGPSFILKKGIPSIANMNIKHVGRLVVALSVGRVYAQERKFKNIIMLIPDGCDSGVLGLARWYKNEPLAVDSLASGSIHPYMANSIMTDSAPGGTAYSTGQLTTDKFISVGPRRDDLLSNLNEFELWDAYAPIPTTLEAAKALGMSTGLLSTSTVSHATPASFAAHVDSRSKEEEITKQMVHNNIDVVMGGGRKNMLPLESCGLEVTINKGTRRLQEYSSEEGPAWIGERKDCLDLELELLFRGYDMCFTKQDLMDLDVRPGQKVWCNFATGHMLPDIDRKHFGETEPSLAEMTAKAIEILSQNPMGFFLMVEGSQVDWAGTLLLWTNETKRGFA
jgi:alkaline phosphatase